MLYYVASGDLSPWDWAVLRTQLFEELGVIGTAKARFLQVMMNTIHITKHHGISNV